jgi:hypothetical protein
LLEPFEELGRDRDFWDHTLDGIAVLGAPGLFQVAVTWWSFRPNK